jgi:hypothetical protein
MLVVRPRQLRWGAKDAEVARTMPGDELVNRPHFNATRAVTIRATPEAIWPWLVQMGCTRAGLYSYDWIDNGRKPSAERIVPELQQIELGQFVPLTPNGKWGMWVKGFEPDRWMLWGRKHDDASLLWSLEPVDATHTRLITRLRVRYVFTFPWLAYYLLQDVGDIFMMRKSMLGIKRRAERAA